MPALIDVNAGEGHWEIYEGANFADRQSAPTRMRAAASRDAN
jgi:hypothetical protein